jgi:hypothetical protein
MDYPHPYITLTEDGEMDFSQAYTNEIGAWDKRTILYGYQDFPEGVDEEYELKAILAGNDQLGLRYISDADARPQGSSQPQAHLWDNGSDPAEELDRLLELRGVALRKFSEQNIPEGAPLSELESVLVPVYLMHRYQVEAVAKVIGGYEYDYGVRVAGAGPNYVPTESSRQQRAVEVLLSTISPETLMLPANIKKLIPPPAMGYSRNRELFTTQNGGGLDPLAMAQSATDNTLTFLLHPDRLARILEQYALYSNVAAYDLDGYLEMVRKHIQQQSKDYRKREYAYRIAEMNERRLAHHLIQLAANKKISGGVSAAAHGALLQLRRPAGTSMTANEEYIDHLVRSYLANPDSYEPVVVPDLPDGSPIGQ